MKQIRLAVAVLGILILFLLAKVAGVSASAPGGGRDPGAGHASASTGKVHSAAAVNRDPHEPAQARLNWQQINSNGFGNSNTTEISAVETFSGYLYAGTRNVIDSAQIFRSQNGTTWTSVTDPGFGNPHDTAPPAILDLTEFGSRLYASTGGGGNEGQIWRTLDGTNWAPMVIAGFSNPDTTDITAFAVYNGMIYAGATNQSSGAQIWRSFTGDNNSWTQVAPAVPGTAAATITGLAEFDGALYAAVESEAPAQIWRSTGGDWETVVSDGFGDSLTTLTGGMAVFSGTLYVGAGNGATGAQLWRTSDGTNWEQTIIPGFGDSTNLKTEAVFLFQTDLYVSVQNAVTGLEVWRSADGTLWEQINQDGFGDANNTGSNWSNTAAEYQGRLYLGTANAIDGGELWQLTPTAVHGVHLSPDDSTSGVPGATVTYTLTITNSGNVTDTFDLAVSGNDWVATLSSSNMALSPGSSANFTVGVTIPAAASVNATDIVNVTATSRGNIAVSDTAVLTTMAIAPNRRIYLPITLRSP